jgi:perosamine synthetase
VHLHPFYRKRFSTGPGLCPVAEHAYEQVLSLPMYPSLSDGEVDRVIEAMEEVLQALAA